MFNIREREEIIMTHSELLAYDAEINEKLTPSGVKSLLLKVLSQETSLIIKDRQINNNPNREKDNTESLIKKPTNDYHKYLTENKEYMLLHESYQLIDYLNFLEGKKFKKIDPVEKLCKPDQYYEILKHEKANNLLKGPLNSVQSYINKWNPPRYTSVAERKKNHALTKRTLEDLKNELATSVKVIKSIESLLKFQKYRSKLENMDAFNEILELNKSII